MKKKIIAALLTLSLAVSMAGCSGGGTSGTTPSDSKAAQDTQTTAPAAQTGDTKTEGTNSGADTKASDGTQAAENGADNSDKAYKIAITQYAEHGSLDNCRQGFIEGLAEEGIVEGENLTLSLIHI